jgi:putative oxygen-independent coproporphyrinogen III oxidase
LTPAPSLTGAYVHLPFCAERCDYCAFALWTDRGHLVGRYVDAVITEIDRARDSGLLGRPETVYLGGGTPSVVPGSLLAAVIGALDPAEGAEITVECNPESTTDGLLGAISAAGVNRISLGVQSVSADTLASLGRRSPPGAVERAVGTIAAAGIDQYGVDLVYGAAAETDAAWRASLDGVIALAPRPSHVSAYALTVEPGTALARDPRRHPDDDTLARRYATADEVLSAAGYRWYEISNFALPGHESRHNSAYWAEGSYLGFGASAHSHLDGHRFRNVWHIDRYLDRIESGRSPIGSEEHLTPSEREFEALVLALRTRRGVPADSLDLGAVADFVDVTDGNAVLNRAGRMLADEVALHLKFH